jgi:hypothetical protein
MFTLGDSLGAVKAFAGEDCETAVFYPKDERFVIERDLRAVHYDVAVSVGGAKLTRGKRSPSRQPSAGSSSASAAVRGA